ncbi:MAG: DNA polymerase IV [Gammaproteobacteria bacterium]|nr:DNA polymerase IV [Gammaproteobacteria bacterium]
MDLWPRIVVHADMDAFYAAVEQLDDPSLRGKPVLVGPKSARGVVLTASYEARPYGVSSAMPVGQALRRCPDAIVVGPRFDRYEEVSSQVMDTLSDFSPRVEALSMDEAFVDMTGAERLFGAPREMGRKIKQSVREATRLNISVGVASTKYVAKVASAHDKPDGLTVVPADGAKAWLAPLPVSRLWGAGPKTVPRLHALGLQTIGDVATADASVLGRMGSLGAHFAALANATDPRPVNRTRVARSIGSDRTLSADVSRREDIGLHLRRASERIGRRLRAKRYVAHGVRVRLKTNRFKMLTRQRKLRQGVDLGAELLAAAESLLDQFNDPGPFRLVGMAAFDLAEREGDRQLDLFEDHAVRELETTVDDLIHRFGRRVLMRARDLADWGTVASAGVNLDYLDVRATETAPPEGA